MAKGPIITDQVRVLIASVYHKHPKWKAPEVRNEISFLMRKINPKLPSSWPSLSSIQKVLATVRKNVNQSVLDPRDEPWSTASMAKYPIPPGALPSVLKAWIWVRENTTGIFTIREAQWVARLYTVIEDIELLANYSRSRSFKEWLSEQTEVSLTGSHHSDLTMFRIMTGEEITPKQRKKILRLSDERWLAYEKEDELFDSLTDEERNNMRINSALRLIRRVRK